MRTIQFFQPKWAWPAEIEQWLAKYCKGKYTLHLPCGSSQVGDIRADIDPTVKPDIICDALNPPFRPHIFQIVVSDPPWKFFSKIKWIHALSDLTNDVFLLNAPLFVIRLKNFKLKINVVTRTNRNHVSLWVEYKRKYGVITQINQI